MVPQTLLPLRRRRVGAGLPRFEGVNQTACVYVNGHFAGRHAGGYTRFVVDITPFVSVGENLVAVEADNRHDPDMPPLSADFTFFGGIYRDVSLLLTHKVHIAPTDMGSSGVYLSTPRVSAQSAEVDVRTLVANRSDRTARLRVEHRIFAPDGSEAARAGCPLVVEPGQVAEPVCRGIRIADPQLWDLDAPNLYRVLTRIVAEDGSELDCVSSSLGLRWFSFDPDKGFFLNGRPRKLVGTCRHQDYEGRGWALTDAMHERDIRLPEADGR